jgi:TPR repeat protein
MIRRLLVTMLWLCACGSASAEESSLSARELAETTLLAEWVGLPEEQYVLGNLYYKGDSVPQDYTEAAKWYRKAADQGHTNSQYMLASMHDRGDGMSPDYIEAVAWYRKAAENGHIPAQLELGRKYASGQGVPQNYAEAYVWFSLAATSGLESAMKERDKYALKLSNAEISAAQSRSMQLFEDIQRSETKE